MTDYRPPQIKVCGLTRPDEARAAADLGAGAIGLVFYPPSPRNVSVDQAAAIVAALPPHIPAVGVFVDSDPENLIRIVAQCGLKAVQLHGVEPPGFVDDLRRATAARVIKALFTSRSPGLTAAGDYAADGFLVECGRGRLPGGNAVTWNWALAEEFAAHYPLALAGGLGPETVAQAITACLPDAVDASSALEASPGRKDLHKVERFIAQVHSTGGMFAERRKKVMPIF